MKHTVREQLLEVTARFEMLEFALFTTFNFSSDFFEQNVLPTLFGADLKDASRKARERTAHKGLMHTRVSVFYDPAVARGSADRFRYGAYPVYLGKQRRFHPKLIVLGGTDQAGTPWIYLAVMSANLTRSGWGLNCEGFADTWLHARKEQPAAALQDFLIWLHQQTRRRRGDEALTEALAFFDRLQERRSKDDPQGGRRAEKDGLRFYASPSHSSLWAFLAQEYSKPRFVRAASPYWGDAQRIASTLDGVQLELIASRGPLDLQRSKLGAETLSQLNVDAATVLTWSHDNARFFHLKMYEVVTSRTRVTGLGSCNFTEAGQFWLDEDGREAGNAECMLFDETKIPWLPTEKLRPTAIPPTSENEDTPPCWPVFIAVEYDWAQHCYRWWLDGDPGEDALTLSLPDGEPAFKIGKHHEGSRHGRLLKRVFQFDWHGETYEGLVSEVNLRFSDLRYGGLLSPQQILESWSRGGASEPEWKDSEEDDEEEGDEEDNGDKDTGEAHTSAEILANPREPFDWFTFFRTLATWRDRIAAVNDNSRELIDLLVARTDSVSTMAAAALADQMPTAGRWIVVDECLRLLRRHAGIPEVKVQVTALQEAIGELEKNLTRELSDDLRSRGRKANPAEVFAWYAKRMRRMA